MLGIDQKPVGILNVDGYFDPLIALLEHGIAAQFINPWSSSFPHRLRQSRHADRQSPCLRALLLLAALDRSPGDLKHGCDIVTTPVRALFQTGHLQPRALARNPRAKRSASRPRLGASPDGRRAVGYVRHDQALDVAPLRGPEEADLVTSRRDGQQIYYSLNTTVLEDVMTRIWDLFGSDNAKGTPSSEYFWLPT